MTNTPRLAAQARTDSPLGAMTLAATDRGLAGLWFDEQAHFPPRIDAPVNAAHPHIAQALRELDAYWHGEPAFHVPLDAAGTPFQRAVWAALLRIAPGCTATYGEIAAAAGTPRAVRAVGAAIGRNPIGIIVPCHRVIGSDGSLTGYAGGLDRKRALLQLESTMRADLLQAAAA
jgi:methylated-DNA-[protein]-cysteine S-methyltransferase